MKKNKILLLCFLISPLVLTAISCDNNQKNNHKKNKLVLEAKEEVVKQEVVKEEVVKQEVVKEEVVKQEVVEEEVVKQDVVKEEVVKKGKHITNKSNIELLNFFKDFFSKNQKSTLATRKVILPSELVKINKDESTANIVNNLGIQLPDAREVEIIFQDLKALDELGQIKINVLIKIDVLEHIQQFVLEDFCTTNDWNNDYKPVQKTWDYFNHEEVKTSDAGAMTGKRFEYFRDLGKQIYSLDIDFNFKTNFGNGVSVSYFVSGYGFSQNDFRYDQKELTTWVMLTVKIKKNNFIKENSITVKNIKCTNEMDVENAIGWFDNLDLSTSDYHKKHRNLLPSEFVKSDLNFIEENTFLGKDFYKKWLKSWNFSEELNFLIFDKIANNGARMYYRNMEVNDEDGSLSIEVIIDNSFDKNVGFWKIKKVKITGFKKLNN